MWLYFPWRYCASPFLEKGAGVATRGIYRKLHVFLLICVCVWCMDVLSKLALWGCWLLLCNVVWLPVPPKGEATVEGLLACLEG
jgi:hypothetical protein